MDQDFILQDFVKSIQNFRWDSDNIVQNFQKHKEILVDFYIMKQKIVEIFQQRGDYSEAKKLSAFLLATYDFIAWLNPHFSPFLNAPFASDVQEAVFYTILCTFLHHTKRIKGKTLREMVYNHSPNKFYEQHYPYAGIKDDILDSQTNTLRQYRHRRLSTRPVYNDTREWSAMPPSSEHEWTLFWDLENAPDAVQDTFKRMGNLYKDIENALKSEMDSKYEDRVNNAYKKFESKLKKINYANVIELYKICFDHIEKNKEYYGMNLYRLEKELSPYKITKEIDLLSKCQSKREKNNVLLQTVALNNIFYPKLYDDFRTEIAATISYATEFKHFSDYMSIFAFWGIDSLIEQDLLGSKWSMLFLDIINAESKNVLYDPSQLDYNLSSEAEELFREILSEYTFRLVNAHLNIARNSGFRK